MQQAQPVCPEELSRNRMIKAHSVWQSLTRSLRGRILGSEKDSLGKYFKSWAWSRMGDILVQ
jgi:hypothetical protein